MKDAILPGKHAHGIRLNVPTVPVALSDTFLFKLTAELDNDDVTAIVLRGSHARGEATSFSDVDLARLVRETSADQAHPGRFLYREGHLISISTRKISLYRERLTVPEQAIYTVPAIREARILLDKDGAFSRLQQEAKAFKWELLQEAANFYASQIMMLQTETVHKILRALQLQDTLALSEMIQLLFSTLTKAVAVQRGLLVRGGNTYFQQVQQAVGQDSVWTHYHKIIADTDTTGTCTTSLEVKGIVALRLYQETARLLQPHINAIYCEVIEQSCLVIEQALLYENDQNHPQVIASRGIL